MKTFENLINETLQVNDLDELESAADLFEFGIEKGYYNKNHVAEFNTTYWKVKNQCLAYNIGKTVKGNKLDILSIVSKAPSDIKNNEAELLNYVNGRVKALKGKMKGFK